jgi:hypothetical protein
MKARTSALGLGASSYGAGARKDKIFVVTLGLFISLKLWKTNLAYSFEFTMPAPSSVEILDEYTALHNRLELIYKSYTLRKGSDSVIFGRDIARELLLQSTALVMQQADMEEIFRQQTGSNRLEEVFLGIGMPDTARERITRYAAAIIDWHNNLETALTTIAPPAPDAGTSLRLRLPSAKDMSEVLATIGSRAELISKDCVRLAARLRESGVVALEFKRQMDGLSSEFGYTRQRWRRSMESTM